jgi:hypothetical protein
MNERGIALVMALLAIAAFSALGLSLILGSSLDRLTSGNHRDVTTSLNAADAAVALAVRELDRIADWTPVLQGSVQSSLVDGPPGVRSLAGGGRLDLTVLTNEITCGRRTACSDTLIAEATLSRPWGVNNAHWRLFAHGRLDDVDPSSNQSPYLVVWVADDASETDGNRSVDGGGAGGEGEGVLRLRADAFGPGALRSAIECTVVRQCSSAGCEPGIRVQSWHIATP